MDIVMKRYRIPVLTAIILVLCQAVALAQTSAVGNMTLNKGIVKVRRAQVDMLYKTAGKQIPVRNLDEIQTGKDSSVSIKLNFKSDELELYSQSFFKIDNVSAQSSLLSMSIGKARFTIKKGLKPITPRKNRKKRFRVRTANAIVGVKGTEFVLAAGTDVTSVLTIEGVVDVASAATPEIEVEVKENQASQIRQASTPTAPVTVPASIRETILNADTPNVFNNVQFGEAVSDTSVKSETKKSHPLAKKKRNQPPAVKENRHPAKLEPRDSRLQVPSALMVLTQLIPEPAELKTVIPLTWKTLIQLRSMILMWKNLKSI
jgi:hypothetical protein